MPLIIVYLAQCPKNKIQVSPSEKVGALGNVRLIAAVCRGAEKIFLKPPCAHGLDLSALGQNAKRSCMCLRVCERGGGGGGGRAGYHGFFFANATETHPTELPE